MEHRIAVSFAPSPDRRVRGPSASVSGLKQWPGRLVGGFKGILILATLALAPIAPALADPTAGVPEDYEAIIALTPDLDNGRRVYLVCAVCHGPEGWGTPDGTYPQIAGQLREVIIKQLEDIRAGNRDNPLMYPFALTRILGGPQHLADVAAYVATLPMTPHNGLGPGVDLELGERLYAENCADCHGERGEGNAEKRIPALAGQHFMYLVRQFEAIRDGRRKNANPDMVKQIAGFNQREEMAVLDYTSRLRPPADKLAAEGWLNPDFPNFVREPLGMPLLPPSPPLPPPPPSPPVP